VPISPTFYEQLLYCTKVFSATFLYVQFCFVTFCWKNIGAKSAHKMLVKLTTVFILPGLRALRSNRCACDSESPLTISDSKMPWSDEDGISQHSDRYRTSSVSDGITQIPFWTKNNYIQDWKTEIVYILDKHMLVIIKINEVFCDQWCPDGHNFILFEIVILD